MIWLITGGCGFIGSSLTSVLLKDEKNIICILDNLSVGKKEDLKKITEFVELNKYSLNDIKNHKVTLIEGDILDEELLMEACKDINVIVHLAANTGVEPSVNNPRHDCITNIIGTLNCLEAARHNNVERFVLASSGAPLGVVEPPLHEELAPHPASPYGASKLSAEGYCSAYYHTFGLDTIALRFGNVYGPGSAHKSSVVAKFIKRAMNGEVLEVYGNGEQTRDYIYINDLIEAIIRAATTENIGGEIFQIATNHETSIHELLDILLPVCEEKNILNVEVSNKEERIGDVKRNYSDTSKAKRLLGWKSDTELKKGIAKTLDWFCRDEV